MGEATTCPVLHNSGPGPVSIYQTGAVGREYRVACTAVLDALQLRQLSRSALRAAVLSAKETLAARDLLPPFRGIVTVAGTTGFVPNGNVPVALPWIPGASEVEQLQWALVAFAHVTPPMLLFRRAPDLTYCTDRQLLRLRWFGEGVRQ